MATYRTKSQAEKAIIDTGLNGFEVRRNAGRTSSVRGDNVKPHWV